MVYSDISNGLNDTLWAPLFTLPTVESVKGGLVPGTVLGDMNIGEMFLNFLLHANIRKYTGLNLRSYKRFFERPESAPDIATWARACMGLTPCSYFCLALLLLALEVVTWIDDPHALDNLF